jgi:type IV secretion system protein VirB8
MSTASIDAPQAQRSAATREDYYFRAASWSADRQADHRKSRKIAWIIAGAATAVALLEAVALVALMPLKTVVPYTVMVDRHTGFVQALEGVDPARITADAALTQSLLAQYVVAREGFDISTIDGDYRKVALWSADAARRDYLAFIPQSNPQSPFNLYPRSTSVAATIKSVSPLGPNSALVRFDVVRRDLGQSGGTPSAYVAVIRYRFSGEPMAIEDRLNNPLGFQVTSYRRDQESVAAPDPMRLSDDLGDERIPQIGDFVEPPVMEP